MFHLKIPSAISHRVPWKAAIRWAMSGLMLLGDAWPFCGPATKCAPAAEVNEVIEIGAANLPLSGWFWSPPPSLSFRGSAAEAA